MHTALLVIDVQQALCSGEYKAFESERVIERINSVTRKARSAGAPVIMIQHESQDGSLDFGHYYLRRLGDGRIRVAPAPGGREKEGIPQN